jgi:L-aspartate oxidase
MESFDFLVIGGGIAGLTFALEAAHAGSVAVLFKRSREDSSTALAQGGIAAVQDESDSFELHVQDTLTAGAGLCRAAIVDLVVREGPERIADLVGLGIEFDRHGKTFDLHREGGHSTRRVLHSADATGWEVQRGLLHSADATPNIRFFADTTAIDLITTRKLGLEPHLPNAVLGAYALLPSGEITAFLAKKTLVATGGAGKIYLYTTNPNVATGDGIAMCFRAGAPVANMEFFQFHPTCLFHPEEKSFLITEAMRGEGARLLRVNGEPFMHRYHDLQELAPRDIVARAIDNEMKVHGEEHVLLDISHRDRDFIVTHFPTIYETCLRLGIDITREPIPVVPAAHYCCGGVLTDQYGQSTIENLFVAGECACTGLHGANRLASNSLLEGLVFGKRAGTRAVETLRERNIACTAPAWDTGSARDSDEDVVITQTWLEIRRFMWNFVGIVRSTKRLERALRRSSLIEREIVEYYWNFRPTRDLLELRNLSLVANLVIHSAMLRRESRGLHYNVDFPQKSEGIPRETVLTPEEYFHFSRRL